MYRTSLVLLLAGGALNAAANPVYICVDANGSKLISTSRINKSCTVSSSGSETLVPAPKQKAAAGPTPGNFPRVSEDAQKARDTDRKRILEQELELQQQQLEQARKQLAEEEGKRSGDEKNYQRVLDRLKPFKDRVAEHERNIEQLNKELAGLR